ncbi:MAG: 50S ribosomal protein L3, partial [Chlamydiia bacterium]|nr:50S ribosomal protein L3 [Chlamydiia bacterium]
VSASEKGHIKSTGSKTGATFCREIRGEVPEGVQIGQEVTVDTFEKGQKVKITGQSKGRGFSGVLKRWNFGGGPAAHGSTFHRQPGSVGNRTWPGRIMPGKKLPGHFGDEQVTVKNVEIVEVQSDEGLLLVKGPVPGARNSLVQLLKQ